jgi:hypothetical protein
LIPSLLDGRAQPPTWQTATRRFIEFVSEFNEGIATYRKVSYDTYTKSWANAQWSKLYRVDEVVCEWAAQTVFITLTGQHTFPDTETMIPPVTFFNRLQSAKAARQKALSRALSGVGRWQSIRGFGSQDGYPVLYIGLYCDTPIKRATIAPVVKAHVDNCSIAGSKAHQPERAITVRSDPSHRSELVHALGRRVPGMKEGGLLAESWHRRATATALHAAQARACRFGCGGQ